MNGVPGQPAALNGVIVYTTATGKAVVLFNDSVIDELLIALLAGVLIPAVAGRLQLNVAPGVELVIV